MKTETVKAKVRFDTRKNAKRILFDITLPNVPNLETQKALDETNAGKGLIACKDADDLFDQLRI